MEKKSIKGSLTEQNLLKAFAGESQAKNRYTFFAKEAKKDGYEQIAGIFMETAYQEETHAKRFFSYLEGGMLEITAAYPAGKISVTTENLEEAAAGEYDEWHNLYPYFAGVAESEDFMAVSALFKFVAEVERMHQERYLKLLENVRKNHVFEREEPQFWYCRECGYSHYGKLAPEVCPSCLHPKAYFEIQKVNY